MDDHICQPLAPPPDPANTAAETWPVMFTPPTRLAALTPDRPNRLAQHLSHPPHGPPLLA